MAEAWQPWTPETGAAVPGLATVIGHRGAAAHSPENTLASLRKARELGASWVEFDVMLSRDEVPVLIHDETVSRTSNGRGRVPDLTLAELRALDAGGWFSPAHKGEPIPTLEQALRLCLELGLSANVEIKPALGHEQATARIACELLLRQWPRERGGLLISSFERPSLATALETAPGVPRGLLAEHLPNDWEEAMQDLGCTTLHLGQRHLRPGELAMLIKRRVPVLFYTVNDAGRAGELLAGGATGLFTDAPDRLLPLAP